MVDELSGCSEGDGRIFEDPSPENRPTLDLKVGPPNSKVGPPKYMRKISKYVSAILQQSF